jgi:pyrimidine oxygenase
MELGVFIPIGNNGWLISTKTGKIPIICAAQSDAGTRFAAEHADYNFCTGGGVNQPTAVASSVARLVTGADSGGGLAA